MAWIDRGWRVVHARSDDEVGDALASAEGFDVAILDVSQGCLEVGMLDWFRAIYPDTRFVVVQDAESEPAVGVVALAHPLDAHDLLKIVDALFDE